MLTSDVNIHHLELPENNQMQTIPSNAEITSDLVNSRFVFVDETFKNQVSMKYLEASKTPSIIATPEKKSPTSNMQSETHIDLQISMDYNENPYSIFARQSQK
eukprot:194987_1